MRPISVKNFPRADIPRSLREVWLAYHQSGLCQELDAAFVFRSDGMEVWCAAADEKAHQKLTELCKPLESSYQIEIYLTKALREKKTEKDKEPPPSLWNNGELRSYLGELLGPRPVSVNPDAEPQVGAEAGLKQRIIGFAEQTLGWAERLRCCAVDLPALAWAATDPAAPSDMKAGAKEACLKHSREIERHAQRLGDNLLRALPRAERQGKKTDRSKPSPVAGSPSHDAAQLAAAAHEMARRVYRFVYPEKFTVGVDDLRRPSLLADLRDLAAMASALQRTISTAGRR